MNQPPVTPDPWQSLRAFTTARIAEGRSGGSQTTTAMLAFQLAHARARDAVHLPFDTAAILAEAGDTQALSVHSAAATRDIYLRRPDLGRRLDEASRQRLSSLPHTPSDIVFVIADGLSPLAVHAHALPVLQRVRPALEQLGWQVGPLVVATQARVALGDEVGERLGARMLAILIGERPGLSGADSLGIYITHAPRVGCVDAQRNCISNIRPDGGLSHARAAHKLLWLLREGTRRQQTGVALKDDSDKEKLFFDDAHTDQ